MSTQGWTVLPQQQARVQLDVPQGRYAAAARAMSRHGRRGDDQVGHLSTGEVVVPAQVLRQKGVKEGLRRGFAAAGADMGRFTVGGMDDVVNPKTGMREYAFGDPDAPDGEDGGGDGVGTSAGPGGPGGAAQTGPVGSGGSRAAGGGGETGRERGIRTAATAPDRTRARGRGTNRDRAFTPDFTARMAAAQTPAGLEVAKNVGKVVAKQLGVKAPDMETVLGKIARHFVPGSFIATLPEKLGHLHENLVEAGVRPTKEFQHPTDRFQDDWRGYWDAETERMADESRDPALPPVEEPVVVSGTEPVLPREGMSEEDRWWWENMGVDPGDPALYDPAWSPGMGSGEKGEASSARMAPNVTGSMDLYGTQAPGTHQAHAAVVRRDIEAARAAAKTVRI